MHALDRVRRAWRGFRNSLLFIPSIMILGVLALFVGVSAVDSRYQFGLYAALAEVGLGFLVFSGSPDSAGRLLSAIVGTWATIVGVVYSVTLVTIQLSATKYSAQVIPVFEKDRLNQVVLGAFTGTFVYALLVLKTIRDDGSFVPVLGVNISILLALVSLVLLIAFIGNLTAYIRPTRFVDDYAEEGLRNLSLLLEPSEEDGYSATGPREEPTPRNATAVKAELAGYVAGIDWRAIRSTLAEAKGVERVDVLAHLGSYVTEGQEIALVTGEASQEAIRDVRAAFAVDRRPNERDPDRVADTLADIGVTALSGGATDIGVAKSALRGILRLVDGGLGAEDPGPAFLVEERLVLVRKRERFFAAGLRQARRMVTKMRAGGYWDVAEDLVRHLPQTFRCAASARQRATWEETLAWWRAVAPDLISFDDDTSARRVASGVGAICAALREDRRDVEALDVEQAFLDAARERGIERALAPFVAVS